MEWKCFFFFFVFTSSRQRGANIGKMIIDAEVSKI